MNNVSIFKYELKLVDQQTIELPVGTRILKIANQRDVPCLWALVPDDPVFTEDYTIFIYGTGRTINGNTLQHMEYIDTVLFPQTQEVYHFFRYTGN